MADAPLDHLPPASGFASLAEPEQNTILDLLFEPSPALHHLARNVVPSARDGPSGGFTSYGGLADAIGKALTAQASSSDAAELQTLDEILGAHPRLGEKKVESRLSRMEQSAMGKASGGDAGDAEELQRAEEEADRLKALNAAYEETFPGLRYVVFVNGRPRTLIMEDMQRRIDRGDLHAERLEAIEAMCDIAQDRARKLQA